MKTFYPMSLAAFLLLLSPIDASSQTLKFRSGIFLHHSTGACIWGPNGSSTSVPAEITGFNTARGLTGGDAVSLQETGWPATPWDNEWERWHRIFENKDTIDADIRPVLEANRIVIIKSCFPSSTMSGYGTPADTTNPTNKTLLNYKWHWRHFIEFMRRYPENFFVVWTNAPLVAAATNDNEARLADGFCHWAADTLAHGKDAVFGAFPPNVYVFDFFHKLAGTDGKLQNQFASGDSHPNAAGTEVVAPLFVREIFDAALNYESILAGVPPAGNIVPVACQLLQNYPNPFNPSTTIRYVLDAPAEVSVKVFDLLGREVATLVEGRQSAGSHPIEWTADRLASGVYFCQLRTGGFVRTSRMVLMLK